VSSRDYLDVYFGIERVGSLFDARPLAFEYAPDWLARTEPMALAAIPLEPGRIQVSGVQACFENLLPEGDLRLHLTQQRQASNLFALLLEVAGDTAGAFVILPGGQTPKRARYQATTWQELARGLATGSALALGLRGGHTRISLAGAQDKTSIALFDDGVPRLPQGASASTHILKPNIRRLAQVWHSAANETLVMRTALHCGLPTAQVFYEPLTQSCVVRRFDRLPQVGGDLARLVQYDLCQLAGTVSDKKYEKEGGPDLATCCALIRHYSSHPAVCLGRFVDWIFFNLYVGNNDSHAKNLSLYHVPGQGVLLTPFYDLMCTRLYPGLSPEFAFAIGGETKPGSLRQEHIAALAQALGMRPQFLAQRANALALRLPAALAQAVGEVQPGLPVPAKALVARLQHFILTTTKRTATRLGHAG
jgi:serine/threonine-protein kinase HipA